MKIYKVKATGARDAFYKIFYILRDTLEVSGSALKVLAELAYFNWRYKDLSEEKRGKLMLSYDTRQYIMEKYGMSQQYLNNQIYYLRKKKILKGNILKKEYQIDPKDFLNIMFTIDIQDERDKKSVLGES